MSLLPKIALVTLSIPIFTTLNAQTDSTKVALTLIGQSFFDNKEFTGNIKKGYTLPGFYIQPAVTFETERYAIAAGFHTLYLAGTDTLERFVPVFSAKLRLNNRVDLIAGTLQSQNGHWLPEALFKPERIFMNQPETGVQFQYQGIRSKADLWLNWERYIKVGSPFQEEFTVGFTHLHKCWKKDEGYSNAFHALVFHRGGQIDSTNLPVQTHVNLGLIPIFSISPTGRTKIAFAASMYYYKNLSPTYTTDYPSGVGFHPRLMANRHSLTLEAGYWYSNGFVNPQGEELYGSISTIDPAYNRWVRQMVTFTLEYEKRFVGNILLNANFKAYYNLISGTLEYSYTLSVALNTKVLEIQ